MWHDQVEWVGWHMYLDYLQRKSQILLFYNVLRVGKLLSVTGYPIWMGFAPTCSISMLPDVGVLISIQTAWN